MRDALEVWCRDSSGGENVNRKIVFYGGGHMAESMIKSMLETNVVQREDIAVSELRKARCGYLNQMYGIEASVHAEERIQQADAVVLAVLPKLISEAAAALKPLVKEEAIILSIAAGIKIEMLEQRLGAGKKIVRVMPNTLGTSGNGYSAVCTNGNVTEEEKAFALQLAGALGQTLLLSESMFNEFTAFSCTGPLWLYQTADALIDAGVYAGFDRQTARKMVVKNMLGTAMLLDETGVEPKERISEMCSPGGVTVEGYKALIDQGFASAIMTSVDRAVKKANALQARQISEATDKN